MAFLDYLVQQGFINEDEKSKIRSKSAQEGTDVDDILLKRGIDPSNLASAKAAYFNIPYKDVDPESVSINELRYIPEESAIHYQFAPIGIEDNVLEVGIVDPANIAARDALQFISSRVGMPYKIYLIPRTTFEAILENYKSVSGEVQKAVSALETDLGKKETKKNKNKKGGQKTKGIELPKSSTNRIVEETPITKIVAVLLRHAIDGAASDIHIEHTGQKIKVRFRVDGVLHTSLFLPVSTHAQIVSRIKVLSNMKLDERRKPQDGSFSTMFDERPIDFRVSTFPAYYGEKVVIRVLDPGKGIKILDETGINKTNIEKLREAIKKPYGLILLTGPTGSGKTTTLYSLMKELNREKNNVVSLEDPVEYQVEGVSQSHVRPDIGYTFANGLRTTLRQDPDVIIVGEIRDGETAQLAIQAALTGHLVLSTLHTNNAAGIIPRLVHMGIDPYLIAPTLILAMAQRLVRVLCPTSRNPIPLTGGIQAMVEKELSSLPPEMRSAVKIPQNVYGTQPSSECPSGTRGRTAVSEVLVVDEATEQIILESPTEENILKEARKQGMFTMKEDALIKAFDGTIPFQEVSRVT